MNNLLAVFVVFTLLIIIGVASYIIYELSKKANKGLEDNKFKKQLVLAIEKTGHQMREHFMNIALSAIEGPNVLTGKAAGRSLALQFLQELEKRFTGNVEITHIAKDYYSESDFAPVYERDTYYATWLVKVSNILNNKEVTAYVILRVVGRDPDTILESSVDLEPLLVENQTLLVNHISYVIPDISIEMGIKETAIIEALEASKCTIKKQVMEVSPRGRFYELVFDPQSKTWGRREKLMPESWQNRNLTDQNLLRLYNQLTVKRPVKGLCHIAPDKMAKALVEGLKHQISFEITGGIGSGKTVFSQEILRRISLLPQYHITRISDDVLKQLKSVNFDWRIFEEPMTINDEGEYEQVHHILYLDQAEEAMVNPEIAKLLLELCDGSYSDEYNLTLLLVRNDLEVLGKDLKIRKDLSRSGRLLNVNIPNLTQVEGALDYITEEFGDNDQIIVDEELIYQMLEQKTDESPKGEISLAEIFNAGISFKEVTRNFDEIFEEILKEEESKAAVLKAAEEKKTNSSGNSNSTSTSSAKAEVLSSGGATRRRRRGR